MQGRSIERRQGLHEDFSIVPVLSRPHIKGTPLPPPQALSMLHRGKCKMQVTNDEMQ